MAEPPKSGDDVLCRGERGVVVRVLALQILGELRPIYAVRLGDGRLSIALEADLRRP